MKNFNPDLFHLTLGLIVLATTSQAAATPFEYVIARRSTNVNVPDQIPGWGTIVDPDGRCTVRVDDGTAIIKVPSGHYDLYYGEQDATKRFNSPRLLQAVEGDFVVQVKVTADWQLGRALTNGRNFSAAGLLIWDSERQYLRLDRTLFVHRQLGTLNCFTTPVYDRDGQRINDWKIAGAEFFKGRSTWLRATRKGQTITTAISHDGRQWIENSVLTTTFPRQVEVGVVVLNGSTREFIVEFDEFNIITNTQPREIPGMGTIVDPDGDCVIRADNGKVSITVPGTKHDLYYGGKDEKTRFNSPRVWQEIEGDFTATVKVTADWKNIPSTGGYHGGGLVVWDSERQYLRVERNLFINPALGNFFLTYTTPLYDLHNRRVFFNSTRDEFFQGLSTWLRVGRTGDVIWAYMSHDGQKWTGLGTFSTDFPEKVRLGIHVTNSTNREFIVDFEHFQITRQ